MKIKLSRSRLAFLPIAAALFATTAAEAATCFARNPLASMTVTSPFGQRFHPVRKVWTCHCGVDLRARTPLPMSAVDAGVVTMSRVIHGGGNTVELRLNNGITVKYMHASELIRQTGDTVAAGDLVGKTGNTGEWTTGPHLHFVAMQNGSTPVDPTQFFCNGVTQDPDPKAQAEAAANATAVAAGTPNANAPVDLGNGVTGIAQVPPIQGFPSLDKISVRDLLYSETHKRFMNPQWYKELENPGYLQRQDPRATVNGDTGVPNPTIYHLRELNQMQTLSNLMRTENHESRTSIEARLAALLSINAKNYSDKVEALTKASAARAR